MNRHNGKKIILGTILAGSIALGGAQATMARPHGGGWGGCDNQPRCQDCSGYGLQRQQPDPEKAEILNTFLAETTGLRKEMAVKRAEKRALMHSEKPDAARVAQLTGDIFELREQLHGKARAAGLNPGDMRGRGFAHGCNGPGWSGKAL